MFFNASSVESIFPENEMTKILVLLGRKDRFITCLKMLEFIIMNNINRGGTNKHSL